MEIIRGHQAVAIEKVGVYESTTRGDSGDVVMEGENGRDI